MSCTSTILEYPAGDVICRGEYFIPNNAKGPLPVVIVTHAWDGLNEEVREKSQKLALEGYIVFAMDVYGGGQTFEDISQIGAVLGPYMADRSLLLARMQAAADAARTIPGADTSRMAAMGYCFGGTAVLDLVRGNVEGIRGAVSFHGGLAGKGQDCTATIGASLLVLHGEDDPLVPPEQVAEFKAEMTARQADWQLLSYGHTAHAFTRPDANDPNFGAVYNPTADRRSWQAMLSFFKEVL